MRRTAAVAVLAVALAGCASSKSPASVSASTAPAGGTTTTAPAPSTTRLPIPLPTPSIDPCKLTATQVSKVVGFAVTRKAKNNPGQCEYVTEAGNVWFSVDTAPTLELTRAKNDEKFSLGGRYVTITDENGFPHEAFTAVKNPGDKSPGVIADFFGWLAPGQLKIRVYYPQGGRPPGRQHVLTLAHMMLA
jgi:hypothetical protein